MNKLSQESAFPSQAESVLCDSEYIFAIIHHLQQTYHFHKNSARMQMCRAHKYRCAVIQTVPTCSPHLPTWFYFQSSYLFSYLFASLRYFNTAHQLEPNTSKVAKEWTIILEEKEKSKSKQTQGKFRVWPSDGNVGFFLILLKQFVPSLSWMNWIFGAHRLVSKAFQWMLGLCGKFGKVKARALLQR